jgi:hypothetical protein
MSVIDDLLLDKPRNLRRKIYLKFRFTDFEIFNQFLCQNLNIGFIHQCTDKLQSSPPYGDIRVLCRIYWGYFLTQFGIEAVLESSESVSTRGKPRIAPEVEHSQHDSIKMRSICSEAEALKHSHYDR